MKWPWSFKRKPVPTLADTDPVDFQCWMPGDVAECLEGGPWFDDGLPIAGPRTGQKSIVLQVLIGCPACDPDGEIIGLRFAGFTVSDGGYNATLFRKITLKDTGADRKVAAPLRLSAPSGER